MHRGWNIAGRQAVDLPGGALVWQLWWTPGGRFAGRRTGLAIMLDDRDLSKQVRLSGLLPCPPDEGVRQRVSSGCQYSGFEVAAGSSQLAD
jgi:hypothetical protein